MTTPAATAAKYRPIVLPDHAVRHALIGDMTRLLRPIKPHMDVPVVLPDGYYFDAYNGGPGWCWWTPDNRVANSLPGAKCPYGVPGDFLWVREAHFVAGTGCVFYRADGDRLAEGYGWLPASEMPSQHSR